MKYAKTLKENLQLVKEGCGKLTEQTLSRTKLSRLNVGDTFKFYRDGTTFYIITDKNNYFVKYKDKSAGKEDITPSTTEVFLVSEGCKKVQEATSNLREGFGELEVYTSFGPGIGVQIYPSRNGELTAHVGYVGSSSGNSTLKKELKTETELKAIDEIKIADLKQIEKVVKKHLDALDSDLQRLFKQYGYK